VPGATAGATVAARQATGVGWILLSSALFATMSFLVKLAAAEFPLVQIIFFRALPGALLLYVYVRWKGWSLWTPHWRTHACRNLVGVGSVACGFYAIAHLPLATATTLEYTAPIFMMAILAITDRHRPGALEIGALCCGFAGVVVLLQPSFARDQAAPMLLGLASGALASAAYLLIRRLGRGGEAPWRTVFFYSSTVLLLSSLALPFVDVKVPSFRGLLILLGVGLTGAAAQLTMTRAYSAGSPTLTSVLQYSTVLFAAAYGHWFWDDQLTAASLLGLALIIGSGAVAAWLTRAPVE
jgi:S-adenosylmethionine uptake transporter